MVVLWFRFFLCFFVSEGEEELEKKRGRGFPSPFLSFVSPSNGATTFVFFIFTHIPCSCYVMSSLELASMATSCALTSPARVGRDMEYDWQRKVSPAHNQKVLHVQYLSKVKRLLFQRPKTKGPKDQRTKDDHKVSTTSFTMTYLYTQERHDDSHWWEFWKAYVIFNIWRLDI